MVVILPIEVPFEYPKGECIPDDFYTTRIDDDYGLSHTCDVCQKDMTAQIRIQCAECESFDICVACFSLGKEADKHKSSHAYRVWDILDFSLFVPDWSAEEELQLITGLELYGMGNWEQVAEYVGSKSKAECAAHYNEVYTRSPVWPLPNMTVVSVASKTESRNERRPKQLERYLQLQKSGAGQQAQPKQAKPLQSHPHNHEIGGFMPARGEFDEEMPDHDAEKAVDVLAFDETDTKEEMQLKLTMLKLYNHTLERRQQRKNFIFQRRLTNFKHMRSADNKMDKLSRDIFSKYRVFAKMMSETDWDGLMQGLQEEQKLRKRIAELQEMRRFGITTREAEVMYKEARREREGYLKSLDGSSHQRVNSHELQAEVNSSSGSINTGQIYSQTGSPMSHTGSKPVVQRSRPAPAALNLDNVEGVELLTFQEKALCSNLRILPRPYLVIKEQLIRESERQNGLRRRQARELINIDVNKTSRIYDFFIEMNWIRAPSKAK